ncbi:MAG: polymer-forming cytoskeletal protein, partial [Proteobacteria bacterium]|nr:polymer-forming cytoskeletal protein [Pseudomonadota bacterium]
DIKLSKKETMEIAQSLDISEKKEIDHLLYVKGNLCSENHVGFDKEVYVTGDALIGPNNMLQALYSEGDVKISEGTQFKRWLDADGNITIGVNCDLGISVSSGNKIHIANNCVFRRLYGMPIVTSHNQTAEFQYPPETFFSKESSLPETSFTRKNDSAVPPGTVINNNIVFTGDIRIGSSTSITGTIKSYGDVFLEDDVIIYGNVFADGDIFIGRNAKISGHLFSQGSIYISEQTLISRPDKIKSIIAKKEIQIEQNVIIYGFVATEGHGGIL